VTDNDNNDNDDADDKKSFDASASDVRCNYCDGNS